MAARGARAAARADAAHRRAHEYRSRRRGRQSPNRGVLDELQKLGWIDGRTARIDMRWPASTQEVRKYSAELVGLAPDVLLATGSAGWSDLLETTRTVPIVFVNVGDPVGGGFVESLARPGGNATGFSFTDTASA